jgi:hypothetical protein
MEKGTVTQNYWGYETKNIYNDESGLFFRLPPNKTLSLKGDPCSGGRNSNERMMVLLACNADETDRLAPLLEEYQLLGYNAV